MIIFHWEGLSAKIYKSNYDYDISGLIISIIIKYYFDNFAAYHNTPQTKDDKPKEKYELSFQLGVNYISCVI